MICLIVSCLLVTSHAIPMGGRGNNRRNIRRKTNRLRNKGLLGNSALTEKLKNELGLRPHDGSTPDPEELCADLWDYHDYEAALEDSAESGKPIMVMICQ